MMNAALSRLALAATFALPAMLVPGTLLAQTPTASIHGHVNNAAGYPITAGEVKLTTDKSVEEKDQKFKNAFPIDKAGDFKGDGIAPGDYLVYVIVDTKRVDRLEVTFKAGDNQPVNFDMTRKEFMDHLSPEDKAAIEDFKKRNAETTQVNVKINNLNATLKAVRDDLASAHPNFDQDVQQMQAAIATKPDEAVLYFNLGGALVAAADAAAADAKAQHKPFLADDTIVKKYNDGIDAYKKGIELNDAAAAAKKKSNPVDSATALNSVGTAYAKLGKGEDAKAAFEGAAKVNPPGAGMYYGNEAAVLFNAGQSDAAAAAADKAIAADPTKPDPYFIRGQALIQKATVDKAGKIVAPPGCVEAYQKYLELAPDGKNAATVQEILTSMGEKVNTKYKAGKK